MALPDFNESSDLPIGIHRATLAEVIERFGTSTRQRQLLAQRLQRIFSLVQATGHLRRFILFGSFVTNKPEPNDIDVFLIMTNDFELNVVAGEGRLIFDHMSAENYEGASVFWIREMAAIGGKQTMIEHWQIKRDKTKRGVIEIVQDGGKL
jgi:hypothetical protein